MKTALLLLALAGLLFSASQWQSLNLREDPKGLIRLHKGKTFIERETEHQERWLRNTVKAYRALGRFRDQHIEAESGVFVPWMLEHFSRIRLNKISPPPRLNQELTQQFEKQTIRTLRLNSESRLLIVARSEPIAKGQSLTLFRTQSSEDFYLLDENLRDYALNQLRSSAENAAQ